jgi:hypothetical protein
MNLSQRQNEQFNVVLVRFAVERLLYRLTRTPQAKQFVLKGAMLFAAWSARPHRPTQDVDLLGFGPPEADRLVKLFQEVCAADVEPDGLVFNPESVTAEPIREDAVYDGLRVRLLARLGTARIPMQVDIGFGDVVSPEPRELVLGPMLDLPAPHLRTYPPETVIAEKFEAMLSLGMANSRMKDYYDLWTLSRTMSFELGTLRTAVRATTERRKTQLLADPPVGLTDQFAADASKQAQWKAFVRRLGESRAAPPLGDVVRVLAEFLQPVFQAGDATARHWPPGGPWQAK